MNTDTIPALEYMEKKLGPLTFGMYIRSLRGIQEISQVKMAKMMGMSKAMLCDIEKDRQPVSVELAAKMAKKLKIPEKTAIQLVLEDQLRRAKLKYRVYVA